MADTKDSKDPKVEIFHRINRLKVKAGSSKDVPPVKFSKELLQNPQKFAEEFALQYEEELLNVLNALENAWEDMVSDDLDKRKGANTDIYHKANHIKDLASTCGYPLMQHFGHSLRDFIEKVDPEKSEHTTIVRAHLDVMSVVRQENIKDEGNEKAKELKKLVEQAIDQHTR